jgi:hypothetical protein
VIAMSKKKVTNEDLLKQIKELQKKVDENNQIVPYIVNPQPVVILKGHDHCTCQHCHPIVNPIQPYNPWRQTPYIISSGQTTLGVGFPGNLVNSSTNFIS